MVDWEMTGGVCDTYVGEVSSLWDSKDVQLITDEDDEKTARLVEVEMAIFFVVEDGT